MLKIFEQQMKKKVAKKVVDRSLFGSRKDRRITELWHMLSKAQECIKTYGHMADYEANPEWTKPRWLRDGEEYTMEKRLEDIQYQSRQLIKMEEEIDKVLFKDCDITKL